MYPLFNLRRLLKFDLVETYVQCIHSEKRMENFSRECKGIENSITIYVLTSLKLPFQ